MADKLRVTRLLDDLGVDVIEGGWPGSNPKDAEYFARAAELPWRHATLAAFGATRRPGRGVDDDPNLNALLDSKAPIVTLVGKSWDLHVTEALRTTLDENLAMVADSIAHLVAAGRRATFDAEHFFDGYAADPAYALAVVQAAAAAGADTVVLCDTNGGSLPTTVARVVREVTAALPAGIRVGVHFHDDSACAVANSLVAVEAGARHVQGAANGYGERCGNADLFAIVAGLELKQGLQLLPQDRLAALTTTAHAIAELANLPPDHRQPYVGAAAFATKAGLHASAIARRADAYSHVDPAGSATRPGCWCRSWPAAPTCSPRRASSASTWTPTRPSGPGSWTGSRSWSTAATPSRSPTPPSSCWSAARRHLRPPFTLEGYRVMVERKEDGSDVSEATVRLLVDGERVLAVGEGVGPVHALDQALRRALTPPPRAHRRQPGRLQGPHPRRPRRHPRRHPGPGHLRRPRRRMDHRRRLRRHRHRLMGSPRRRHPLRPPPRQAGDPGRLTGSPLRGSGRERRSGRSWGADVAEVVAAGWELDGLGVRSP